LAVAAFWADLVIGWFKARSLRIRLVKSRKNDFASDERRVTLVSSGNMFFVWRERCF
jgi:hypothetical protein